MNDTIAPPPLRAPRPVTDEPALTGKRLIVAVEDPDLPGLPNYTRDYRAASEVIDGADGQKYVNVVTEVQWYAWVTDPDPGKPARCPKAFACPTYAAWVE